jgi:hypothetical protein
MKRFAENCAPSRGYTAKLRRSAASSHVGAKHGFPRAWRRIDGHAVDTAAKSLAFTVADWSAWLVFNTTRGRKPSPRRK